MRDKGYHALIQSSPDKTSYSTADSLSYLSPDKRFGKKVFMDNKLSNKEVLEIHLQQMREKDSGKKFNRDMKLQEDKDFLGFVKD